MRLILGTSLLALVLAGCAARAPNDQDQYFDNINPDPTQLGTTEPVGTPTSTVPQTVQTPTDTAAQQPVVVATENPEISNTQDFTAVKQQETIASDAAKLAALKEKYTIVEPEALPQRSGGQGPNLAAYALSQKQQVGQRVYRRFNSNGSNCGRYRKDPDAAQRAFLQAGGPERDRQRLDPDGDGFACTWDPNTYRRLLQQGATTSG